MLKLYSTHCPVCNAVIRVLTEKNIEFEEITNQEEIEKVADENNIDSVPFAVVEDGTLLPSSIEIMNYAKEEK